VVCEFDNEAKDHRLSVGATAPVSTTVSIAGQPFHVIERPLKVPSGKNWQQPPATNAPLQGFCAVEDRRGGLAFLTRGLYDYRAAKEGNGTALKLTLLRAVGWLSREALPTRPGAAGPVLSTPEAQGLGTHRFEYAILPYSGGWRNANVPVHAQRFQAPVIDEQLRPGMPGASLPAQFSMFRVEPTLVQFSALKRCMHRDTVVFRIYNPSSQRLKAKIQCGKPLRHAWKVTLAENRIEELPVLQEHNLEVDMPAWRIVTIELEIGRSAHGT